MVKKVNSITGHVSSDTRSKMNYESIPMKKKGRQLTFDPRGLKIQALQRDALQSIHQPNGIYQGQK
jgi:hypothetical protein